MILKIGVDLDGVIFDSERIFRVYTDLHDVIELHQISIIDNREIKFQDRYNWTQNIIDDFMDKYQTNIIMDAPFMPGAKEVLKMLKEEGHQLIIITARGNKKKEHIAMTEDILKKNDMYIFDKYIWGVNNKSEICANEKLDLMIEDSDRNCKVISDKKIKTIYFKDAPNYEIQENEYLKTLYNWGEVYRYIKEASNEH